MTGAGGGGGGVDSDATSSSASGGGGAGGTAIAILTPSQMGANATYVIGTGGAGGNITGGNGANGGNTTFTPIGTAGVVTGNEENEQCIDGRRNTNIC